MNKNISKVLLVILCLSLILTGCTKSPVVDKPSPVETPTSSGVEGVTVTSTDRVSLEAPYNGDYILAVNTAKLADDLQFSGRLPFRTDGYETMPTKKTEGNTIEGYSASDSKLEARVSEKTYEIGETVDVATRDFYEFMQTNPDGSKLDAKFYDVSIQLVYSGEYCTVWGQASDVGPYPCDFKLAEDLAKRIADEFDGKMYPFMTESFGTSYDLDKDGKVAIVCLDLIDYYNYEIYDNYYFNGYCDPSDWFVTSDKHKMDMIVLDLWPTLYDTDGETTDANWDLAMVTLIHEYQHLINYSYYVTNPKAAKPMDVWMNEGFSTIAENMYTGKPVYDFIDFYKADNDGILAAGRSPMQYEGFWEDYALVYFFSLYLLEQTKDYEGGGKEIFRSILESGDNDYQAIENALTRIGYPVTDFSEFLFNFRVALVANEDSGFFSFNKNLAVQNLPVHLFTPDAMTEDELRMGGFGKDIPGGGALLLKPDGEFNPVGQGPDIRFAGITLEK